MPVVAVVREVAKKLVVPRGSRRFAPRTIPTVVVLPEKEPSLMHAVLLTVLALNGAPPMQAPVQGVATAGYASECDACGRSGHHHGCGECWHDWCGAMPQSCYNPSFGCYPSTRFMHRYPAFHNYYYRAAYNYRHYFDYPWHAGLHEPTSMFSYHVPGEIPGQSPVPLPPADREMLPRASRASGHSVVVPAAGQR
jgi:hypothetical protein